MSMNGTQDLFWSRLFQWASRSLPRWLGGSRQTRSSGVVGSVLALGVLLVVVALRAPGAELSWATLTSLQHVADPAPAPSVWATVLIWTGMGTLLFWMLLGGVVPPTGRSLPGLGIAGGLTVLAFSLTLAAFGEPMAITAGVVGATFCGLGYWVPTFRDGMDAPPPGFVLACLSTRYRRAAWAWLLDNQARGSVLAFYPILWAERDPQTLDPELARKTLPLLASVAGEPFLDWSRRRALLLLLDSVGDGHGPAASGRRLKCLRGALFGSGSNDAFAHRDVFSALSLSEALHLVDDQPAPFREFGLQALDHLLRRPSSNIKSWQVITLLSHPSGRVREIALLSVPGMEHGVRHARS